MNMQNVTAWRPDGTRVRRFRSQRIPNSKSSGPIAQFTSSSAKRPELTTLPSALRTRKLLQFHSADPSNRTLLGHNMALCLTRSSRNGAKITQHRSFGQRGLRAGAIARWMPMASTTGEADHYSWFAAGLRRKTRHHFQLSLALRSLRPSPGI
jgi:hypothetical protein